MFAFSKKALNFILVAGILFASFSCISEIGYDELAKVSDGRLIRFGASYPSMTVETKTDMVTSMSSFQVSSVDADENAIFTNVTFSDDGVHFSCSQKWPNTDITKAFYASNAALTHTASGATVTVDNSMDVICAYLEDPDYMEINELTFEHIFARITDVDVSELDCPGIVVNEISFVPYVEGTYNLLQGAGKNDGTGWSGLDDDGDYVIASSRGKNINDHYFIPGIYRFHISWDANDAVDGWNSFETYATIPLKAGKANRLTFALGYGDEDIAWGVDLEDGYDYDSRDNLDYLTFYAAEAGTIGWKCNNASIAKTIQYSKDFGETWTDLTSTTSGATFTVDEGDIVWFKGNNTTYGSSSNYNHFTMSNDTYVYGNVNSLISSMGSYCFKYLFYNCSKLKTYEHKRIVLPATTLANYCYAYMFYGCTSLTKAPELPATTLANYCYYYMFQGCTSLIEAPELPAITLASNCYQYMFQGCTSLTKAPELPATTLARNCYQYMFQGCTSLTEAPELPATTLTNYCYAYMFYNCSSLTKAPELPATTLANYCYAYMFYGCTSLTEAPELPATTLAGNCYQNMFRGCTSLTKAPELPATSLTNYCYYSMFYGCTSLTEAPELPATTLTNYCYTSMFSRCTSLTKAPDILPALTLANNCYQYMFSDCAITKAPKLPANTLASNCYMQMFYNCKNLSYIDASFITEPGASYTSNWVYLVASTGVFVKNPSASWDVVGNNGVPTGWTIVSGSGYDHCAIDIDDVADDIASDGTYDLATIKSYVHLTNGTDKPIPWGVRYFTDGGSSYSDTAPSWLSSLSWSTTDNVGSTTGVVMSATVTRPDNSRHECVIRVYNDDFGGCTGAYDSFTVVLPEPVISFGSIQIAPGNLYYDGTEYVIDDDWKGTSWNTYYGTQTGSYYHNFVDMGKLFTSASFSESSGNMINLLDPLDGWRVPTILDLEPVFDSDRDGATINGTEGCLWAAINILDYAVGDDASGTRGVIVFPDNVTITGHSIANIYTNASYNAGTFSGILSLSDLTCSELDVYLDAGCVFFPETLMYNSLSAKKKWSTFNASEATLTGMYMTATSVPSDATTFSPFLFNRKGFAARSFEPSITDPSAGMSKSNFYVPVRLVKDIE